MVDSRVWLAALLVTSALFVYLVVLHLFAGGDSQDDDSFWHKPSQVALSFPVAIGLVGVVQAAIRRPAWWLAAGAFVLILPGVMLAWAEPDPPGDERCDSHGPLAYELDEAVRPYALHALPWISLGLVVAGLLLTFAKPLRAPALVSGLAGVLGFATFWLDLLRCTGN